MTTTLGERVFVDTNVLLTALDRGRQYHLQAFRVLNELPNQGVRLCVSGQVLRELLAVSTRPPAANGLGLTLSDAIENARAILDRCSFLEETREVHKCLLAVLSDAGATGKQVHDANLVATMTAHGVTTLITDNPGHFARYSAVQVVPLDSICP